MKIENEETKKLINEVMGLKSAIGHLSRMLGVMERSIWQKIREELKLDEERGYLLKPDSYEVVEA